MTETLFFTCKFLQVANCCLPLNVTELLKYLNLCKYFLPLFHDLRCRHLTDPAISKVYSSLRGLNWRTSTALCYQTNGDGGENENTRKHNFPEHTTFRRRLDFVLGTTQVILGQRQRLGTVNKLRFFTWGYGTLRRGEK
jgi:hypothetical protein